MTGNDIQERPATADVGPLELNKYLPYLINRVGSHMVAAFEAEIRDRGLNVQMWRVLAVLHERGGQRLGALSEGTSIEVSTLSRLIGRMRGLKLVRRTRDTGDSRAVRIALTPQGLQLVAELVPMAREFETQVSSVLSADEIAVLKRLLNRLHGAV